jgi:hypothetical protein
LRTAEDSTICRWVSPTLDRMTSAFGLDIDICREDVTGTKALMSSLKTVVEAYLGTNICFASLSHDDVLGYQKHSYKLKVAEEALQALGLRQVLPSIPVARSFICAHMPSEKVPAFDEEPWVVLAVEYSSHWFNMGLYTIEEDGKLDPIHGWVEGLRVGEQNQLEVLKDRLRDIIASPHQALIFRSRFGTFSSTGMTQRTMISSSCSLPCWMKTWSGMRMSLIRYMQACFMWQTAAMSLWTQLIMKCVRRLHLAASGAPSCIMKSGRSCKRSRTLR